MMIYALACKGPHHQENEDRVVVGSEILVEGTLECAFSTGVLALADGVGGNKSGAVASQFVAEALCSANVLNEQALQDINASLVVKSKQHEILENMATTLTCMHFEANSHTVYHAGNTRAYGVLRSRYLQQLTVDDTVVQTLQDAGRLSPEEAKESAYRSVITTCFGGGAETLLRLKTIVVVPEKFSAFVLTSDGVHDHVTVDELEETLTNHLSEPTRACERIAELARERGSQDDQSIIIAVC